MSTAPAESTDPLKARGFVVLDTSAIMSDPQAHLAYPGKDVVVPLTVIDELDNNKNRPDSAGRNAREFLREVEQRRLEQDGCITEPVPLPEDATLRIEPNGLYLEHLVESHLDPKVADHRIIAAADGLATSTGRPVLVVSNDAALRVKAAVLGLTAAEHTPGRIGVFAPHHTGYVTRVLTGATISAMSGATRPVPIADLPQYDRELLTDVLDNEFVIAEGTAVCMRKKGDSLVRLDKRTRQAGLRPRNKEQEFALDLLADPGVKMIALRGHAGTGKTLCALAAGLQSVADGTHNQLMILRPLISVGRQDVGFLPGSLDEKLGPWFESVVDALIAMAEARGETLKPKDARAKLDEMVEEGKIVLSPVTFLRGRTLHRAFVILDEGQNLSASTVKTVISRLGETSRLVITGDDGQIDVPFASALTCGMNVAVDAFAGTDVFGQVFFKKGERSRLADLASERM